MQPIGPAASAGSSTLHLRKHLIGRHLDRAPTAWWSTVRPVPPRGATRNGSPWARAQHEQQVGAGPPAPQQRVGGLRWHRPTPPRPQDGAPGAWRAGRRCLLDLPEPDARVRAAGPPWSSYAPGSPAHAARTSRARRDSARRRSPPRSVLAGVAGRAHAHGACPASGPSHCWGTDTSGQRARPATPVVRAREDRAPVRAAWSRPMTSTEDPARRRAASRPWGRWTRRC